MDKFWMVWNENGGRPMVRHPSQFSAEQEAERLARQNPGQNFIILESQKFCFFHSPVIWKDTGNIPF